MNRLALLVLVGCGTSSTPEPPELSRHAALLTHAGDQVIVTANADVTWTSSNPEAISIDASGTITANVEVGSAQITAAIGDVESEPMLVVVAPPVDNAVLIDDAQVLEGPTPVDPERPLIVGSRLRLTLGNVAVAPGQILLARDDQPIAGKVVAVDGGEVELELVPMGQLFEQLSIDTTHHLQATVESPAAKPRVAEPGIFKLGPLECRDSPTLSAITGDVSLKNDLDLVLVETTRLTAGGGVSQLIGMTGSVVTTGTASLKFAPAVGLATSCRVRLTEFPLPITGAVSVIAGFQLAVGLRGDLTATLQATTLEATAELKLTAQVTAGFNYNGVAFEPVLEHSATSDGSLKLDVGDPASSGSLLTTIALGPTLTLEAGLHLPLVGTKKLSLLEAFFGLRLESSISNTLTQLTSPTLASKYEAKLAANLAAGSDVRAALEFVGGLITINPPSLKAELKLARSPTGTLEASHTTARPGEQLDLDVDFDSATTSFFDVFNLDEVRIYHSRPGLAEPELLATLAGVTNVTYAWKPTLADVGPNRLWAVVVTKLAPHLPLEIKENSEIVVDVKPPNLWHGTLTWSAAGEESEPFRSYRLSASGTASVTQSEASPTVLDELAVTGMLELEDVSVLELGPPPVNPNICVYGSTTTTTLIGTEIQPMTMQAVFIVDETAGIYQLLFKPSSFIARRDTKVESTLAYGPANECAAGGTDTSSEPDQFTPATFPFATGTFEPGSDLIVGTFSMDAGIFPTATYELKVKLER